MKQTFTFIAVLLLAGCSSIQIKSSDEGTPTGMNRTRETKDESGKITKTTEPIKVKRSEPDGYLLAPKVEDDKIVPDRVPNENADLVPSAQIETQPNQNKTESHDSDDQESSSLEAGYVLTRLWSSFSTDFKSPSFNNIKWDSDAKVSGEGGELNLLLANKSDERSYAFLLGLGFMSNLRVTNAIEQNGFYAREKTKSFATWGNAGFQVHPLSWAYVQILVGYFVYGLETQIETNAPIYTYDGLSGLRGFGTFGIGGGLETPWDFPLRLFTGTRILIPLGEGAFYEHLVGQVNGGLRYRF